MSVNKLKLILALILFNVFCNCYGTSCDAKRPSSLVDFCKKNYNEGVIFPAMEFQRKKIRAEFEIPFCCNCVSVCDDYYLYKAKSFNIYVPIDLYAEFWKIVTNKSVLDGDFIEKSIDNYKYKYVLYLKNINKVIFVECNN